VIRLFVLLVCSMSSFWVNAQTELSKTDQKELREACEIYVRQREQVLTDYNSPVDSLANVTSEIVMTVILLQRDYFKEADIEGLVFPETTVSELITTDSIGCILTNEFIDGLKVNLEKIEDKWCVVGYDNKVSDEEDIEGVKKWIRTQWEKEEWKDTIKLLVADFVQKWSLVRKGENPKILDSVTTKSFNTFLARKVVYDSLQHGYARNELSIKEIERVRINDDTSVVRVHIKGMGKTSVMLLRQDSIWRVAGVDRRVFSDEDVEKINGRIEQFKVLDSFNLRLHAFDQVIEPFFESGDRSLLKDIATDRFIDQLELFRGLAGKISPEYLRIYGLGKSSFPENDFSIRGDMAYYDLWKDSIRFARREGVWLFDELFAGTDVGADIVKAHEHFDAFCDRINLSYSFYNAHDNMDMPVVSVPTREEEIDTVYYDRYEKNAALKYQGGTEALYKALRSIEVNDSNFSGRIYIQFVVDHLGIIHRVEALNHAGTSAAKLAERAVESLDGWLPYNGGKPCFKQMVVAIDL